MPRPESEELVKKACLVAVSENKPLIEVVKQLAGDLGKTDAVDWQALARPENYLGAAEKMIDAVLQRAKNLSNS
jgi:hypothetical protein